MKKDVKRFIHGPFGPGRNSSWIFRDVPEVPVSPVNRCRMKRGRGRCRGTASELALTQMCAYHQTRQTGDLNVDGLRCFYASNTGLFQLIAVRLRLTRAVWKTTGVGRDWMKPCNANQLHSTIQCGPLGDLRTSASVLAHLPYHDISLFLVAYDIGSQEAQGSRECHGRLTRSCVQTP